MKKHISVILLMAILLGCTALYSCGDTTAPTADAPSQTTDDTDEAASIRLQPFTVYGNKTTTDGGFDVPLQANALPAAWLNRQDSFRDKNAPKTFTTEVFGKTYTHEYSESWKSSLYESPTGSRLMHHYGDLYKGSISIDAQSQKVVRWQAALPSPAMYDKVFKFDENSNRIYDMEISELQKIAEGYAKELIGSEQLKEYAFSFEVSHICFYRMINGQKTNEYICMNLKSDGTLHSFDLMNIGLYDDISDFAFDEEKANKMIDEQLQQRYEGKKYWLGEKSIRILMLPSGQLAYEYSVTADVAVEEYQNKEGETIYGMAGDVLTFVITADE